MESTFIRGFVLLMALTGFGATTISSHAPKANGKIGVHANEIVPIPMCPFHDPNGCGID